MRAKIPCVAFVLCLASGALGADPFPQAEIAAAIARVETIVNGKG
jgi:hypothetical protein